jgi:hypothetical protein
MPDSKGEAQRIRDAFNHLCTDFNQPFQADVSYLLFPGEDEHR